MPNITTCSECNVLYEEVSAEEADNSNRLCLTCFDTAADHSYSCRCSLCKKYMQLVPPKSEE